MDPQTMIFKLQNYWARHHCTGKPTMWKRAPGNESGHLLKGPAGTWAVYVEPSVARRTGRTPTALTASPVPGDYKTAGGDPAALSGQPAGAGHCAPGA